MRKYLIILVGVISLLGISTVKADTLSFSTYYDDFDYYVSLYIQNKTVIDDMISLYEENNSLLNPYYFVNITENFAVLTYSSSNETKWQSSLLPDIVSGSYYVVFSDNIINTNSPWESNFISSANSPESGTIINHGFVYTNNPSTYDSILYPSFTSTNYDFTKSSFEIEEGDYIPAYLDLYNGSYHPNSTFLYIEVNLNNYSYVALSLKDYTERDEFYTNVYVKGNYCITSVYNYGLTERKDVISGTKMQSCSPYYDDFTPVKTYILKNDIKNHAIYYLKAYDTSKENKVKVDTSIFNVHYITEEEENNPILNINGRNYTPIPYSDLTDTATISEEEGYVSGAVCGVGDFNCMSEHTGFKFSDIFTKPLEFFKNIIVSVATVFALINALISVLPEPMQYFLYTSFMLAIVLGVIKVIL